MRNKLVYTRLLILFLTGTVWSQVDLGTYKGCSATDTDFTYTKLVTGSAQPLKVAFDLQPNNAVDLYFVEKGGVLKMRTASTGLVTTLGYLPVATGNEDGLVGIALDPGFKTSKTLFLMYSFSGGTESTFRISRFMLNGTGKLDLTSEKILIKINSVRGRWHTAGAMVFDAYGDLWVTIGDNEEQERGPANTADMRGGIIRIHPDKSPKGYSIPTGNFGATMAERYATSNPTLSAQYADTLKALPEIYIKGTRNAYTLNLDPVRRWAVWGDVGPDQGAVSEEYNLEKAPDYMGWPYFAGSQSMGGVVPYGNVGMPAVPTGIVKTAPVNNFAGLTGIKSLPAVKDPIYAKKQSCAMAGPIFRYNGDNSTSPSQFPPQMDRKWIIADCNQVNGFHLLTLNAAGDAVTANIALFSAFATGQLTDLKQGPEGALYVVNQGSGTIDVIRYKGACQDASLKLEVPVTELTSHANKTDWLKVASHSVSIWAPGPHSIRVVDLNGKTVYGISSEGVKTHTVPFTGTGLQYLVVTTRQGTFTTALAPF